MRACQISSRSASFSATRIAVGARASQISFDLLEARLALGLGAVQLDHQRGAGVRAGSRRSWRPRRPRIERLSIISIAPGTMPVGHDLGHDLARLDGGAEERHERAHTPPASGTTRSQIFVATPSVPSEPTNAPSRS